MTAAAGQFVGRDRELRALRGALDAATGGALAVARVTGEAGIGKTALVEHFVASVGAGADVCWARCPEGGEAPPLWPWQQVLGAVAARRGTTAITEAAGGSLRDLASIAPALSPPTDPAGARGDEQSRLRQADALSAALSRLAQDEPTVVVIDDLHWADSASLALLRYLVQDVREHRLLLVVTYRDGADEREALNQAVATVVRSGHDVHVALPALVTDEIAAYVSEALRAPVDDSVITTLERRTGGNPFYLGELARLLSEQPRGDLDLRTLVPGTVTDVVERRIALLPAGAAVLLEVGAVIGQDVSLDLLEAVDLLDPDSLLTGLDGLERVHLVEGCGPGTWRFAHAIVRDVVLQRLTTARRSILHRRVAAALETLSAGGAHHVEALAHHWSQAGGREATAAAARYARQAGDAARAQFAHEDAVRHYLHAVDLLGEPSATHEVGELLVLSAEEARLAEDDRMVRELVARAVAVARARRDAQLLARAALTLSPPGGRTVHDDDAVALFEEALASLDTQSVLRIQVETRLAMEFIYTDPDRARSLSERALAAARAHDDVDTLVAALAARRYAVWKADTLDDQLAIGAEILALAATAGRPELCFVGHYARTAAYQQVGNLPAADAEMAAVARAAGTLRRPHEAMSARLYAAMTAELEGRYDTARTLLGEVLARAEQTRDTLVLMSAIPLDLILQRDANRIDAALAYAGSLADLQGVSTVARAFQLATRAATRRPIDVADLDRCVATLGDRPTNWLWLAAVAEAAVCAHHMRVPVVAGALRDLLVPYADAGMVVTVNPFALLGPAQLYAGLCAATLGDRDEAVERLVAAARQSERIGARPAALRAYGALAAAQASGAGDPDDDGSHALRRGAHLASELPPCFMVDEFDRLVAGIDPRQRVDGQLTARELDVMRHAAAGATNEQIAAALHLSVKTIERHLSNSYVKLGVRNRAEAAALLARDGRLEAPGR